MVLPACVSFLLCNVGDGEFPVRFHSLFDFEFVFIHEQSEGVVDLYRLLIISQQGLIYLLIQ